MCKKRDAKGMNGTVKQFKDTLEEMRKIYPFKDDETRLSTHNIISRENNYLQIQTVDDETGISVCLAKHIDK